MRAPIFLALAAVTVIAGGAIPIASTSAQQGPGLASALDRYTTGDFVGAIAQVTTAEALKGATRWPRELKQWANTGGTEERRRRTNIAVAFALEATSFGVDGTTTEYRAISPVLETACEIVRTGSPGEDDHQFHLAAVALLQGANENVAVITHAEHAAARTPDSRFFLAGVTAHRALHIMHGHPIFHGYLNRLGTLDPGTGADTRALRQLLAQITRLVDDRGVGLEARLRRGVLTFLMREPGDGREDFTAAAQSSDRHVAYLAHMMLGVLHERQQRLPEAVAEYRNAKAIVSAPSATMRLSYALFMNGEQAEAGVLALGLQTADPLTDPWYLYSLRDYRFWPAYRERLRAMVK